MNAQIRDYAAAIDVIERAIKTSSSPLCAGDLYEIPMVREVVTDRDDVSKIAAALYSAKKIGRVPFASPTFRNTRFGYVAQPTTRSPYVPRTAAGKEEKAAYFQGLAIKFRVEGRELELSVVEARQLYRQLGELFAKG